MTDRMLARFYDGRTDVVFDLLAAGYPPDTSDGDGVSLLQWCAYYGDVSAIKLLISRGALLSALGDNLGLEGAAFHGHWQLCQFLIENGGAADLPNPDTGETPLHATLCRADTVGQTQIVRILLAAGADPSRPTKPDAVTGGFMRDARTRGETPLHRAAAFADEESIQLLLAAGAKPDVKDAHGDTPLSWASWYQRPTAILALLCYGSYRIKPGRLSMNAYLTGRPHL